jgi:hypothetical protein
MGNEDEKVLTQADVDALVALVPDKPRTSASSAKPISADKPAQPTLAENARTSTPVRESPSSNTSSSSEVAALQKALADLTRQVNKLINTTQRIDFLEERVEQLARQSPHNKQPAEERIDEIYARLQEFSHNLTNRRELRDDFQCEHCKSKGTVAFLTKCTSCGRERWFGWWPKKKSR